MKRILPLLLLLALGGSAFGQGVRVLKTPRSTYDMEADPTAGSRMGISGSGVTDATNTAAWNAANDANHIGVGGYRRDLTVRPGIFMHDGMLRIGIDAAQTQVRSGGVILGSGGFSNFFNSNAFNVNAGTCTRLVNTNTTDTTPLDGYYDGADMLYGGCGWQIGNWERFAFDLPDQTAWTNRATHTKKETGLRIQASGIAGPPNASYLQSGMMAFMGYRDAILIQPKTGFDGQANNQYWRFLIFDTCETCYHINDMQSVVHEIDAMALKENIGRGIYMERGGHVHVKSMDVLDSDCVVAEIGDNYQHAHGELVIDGLKLDNQADNLTLLKLGAYNGQNRSVFITGSVGSGVTFNAGGAVQGISAGNDKIFIRFTGDPTNAATLNAYSTIDADGNYLP